MKVLVLNCGSSSLKYQLFDMVNEKVMAKGLVERIGMLTGKVTYQPDGKEKVSEERAIPNHEIAIKIVMDLLVNDKIGVLSKITEINAVGHRVTHGGDLFNDSVIIDKDVKEKIQKLIELAPLHNPPALTGIEACEKVLPSVKQVAVFDTAFHQTIPDYAYLYGLPYEMYKKYAIRRYGFHGTSHKFVSQRAAALMNIPLENSKIITCHLGNGASITAVKNGKSVETSMGFTPLEGLMMGTRCGDIDPAIVSFLMHKEHWNYDDANNFFNKQCGVLGVSGVSSDFRDVQEAAEKGNRRSELALELFAYNVIKYIGSYVAVMDGVDGIVFTAGLGENSAQMRTNICKNMNYLGIKIDEEKNAIRGQETIISAADSKKYVMVIPTNEELMIARDTTRLVKN